MVSVLTLSLIHCGFESLSGQTKYYKTGRLLVASPLSTKK
jgi:hypothetical protein